MAPMNLQIGSTVWFFDINRRIYPKDGGIGRRPIWREHWRPEKISSETSRSWVTEWDRKIPKKGPLPHGVAICEEEIQRLGFIEEHRWRIAEHVRSVRDYDTLRMIADLCGYKAE